VQGYQGPGGLHDWSPTKNNSLCIGGITGYIDKVSRVQQTFYVISGIIEGDIFRKKMACSGFEL
jgi:hypothetical protein